MISTSTVQIQFGKVPKLANFMTSIIINLTSEDNFLVNIIKRRFIL